MSDQPTSTTRIDGYHAHVYYNEASRRAAEKLAEAIGTKFALRFGGFFDKPVGPHPVGNLQIIFTAAEFADFVPWLMLNRGDLDILIHPLTDDSHHDHGRHALWLGTPVALRLEAMGRTYPRELLPSA
ncbi:MAG TPA: DOPA 4,5-dioxygenase family protein [Stellaceae bacterium]|nr:DOPA 4,5-dioxygenase family protein [Stellaceae bacterium]